MPSQDQHRTPPGLTLLITGGSGFLGNLLARTLLARGAIDGRPIARLVLTDQAPPPASLLADPRVQAHEGTLLDVVPRILAPSIAEQPFDGVFHLAAAVSAECEADFELGMRSNLDSTRVLLDALRRSGRQPRVVFASSAAVFGGDPPGLPLPGVVRDETLPTPQTSYGTQKLIGEQLIADYTRKGFIDGRAVRLLTVSVRPGRPNGAASGFLSGIIREPLAGVPARCPVALDTAVALASPEKTIAALRTVFEAERAALGGRTALNLPALSVTVQDMLAALERVAGPATRGLVEVHPDPSIERIVGTWPARFESRRAEALGLTPDRDFDSIIRAYIAGHPDAVRARVRD